MLAIGGLSLACSLCAQEFINASSTQALERPKFEALQHDMIAIYSAAYDETYPSDSPA
jgi:hypothetical protein